MTDRAMRAAVLKCIGPVALVLAWGLAVRLSAARLIPGPLEVLAGLWELARKGTLFRHEVASLFRVTWGFLAAAVSAVPLGLLLGWSRRGELAIGPFVQVIRPISPLAWIPIAILWFGVGDLAAVFIILVGSFLPLLVVAMSAVRNVHPVHLQVGLNLELGAVEILRRIVFPSALPQIIVGLRLTFGIAWLVVVAAEMLAVSSGLGFLIIDARNAGNRYDLVIGGMVMIGLSGLVLDMAMRRLEHLPALRWARRPGTAP